MRKLFQKIRNRLTQRYNQREFPLAPSIGSATLQPDPQNPTRDFLTSICKTCGGKELTGCPGCIEAICSAECDGTSSCEYCAGEGEWACESCDEGTERTVEFVYDDEGDATWEWGGETAYDYEERGCEDCGGDGRCSCAKCDGEGTVECPDCQPCAEENCTGETLAPCLDC